MLEPEHASGYSNLISGHGLTSTSIVDTQSTSGCLKAEPPMRPHVKHMLMGNKVFYTTKIPLQACRTDPVSNGSRCTYACGPLEQTRTNECTISVGF